MQSVFSFSIGSKLQLVPDLNVEGAENEREENSSYHLVLNRDKIKETGVKTEDIISRIQPYLSQGVRLDAALGDQHFPFIMNTDVRSAASQPGKDMFALLGNETFRTKEGKTTKLQQPLSPASVSTLSVYRERDGKPISIVTANITTPDVEKATKQSERVLEGVSLPKGVSYSIGGISQQMEQMIVDMAIALSISTLLVLFIVSTVFRGWKAPVSVLVCIPLLLIGSVWGMVLFGMEWNLAAFIGVLMLVGIVVTNGIVPVDKIERNIRSGMMPKEAILQGTLSRVRPVLMTAFTTILTLLPLALSSRTDSVISQTLGIVVVGGMLSSTLISLLFIPILYDWLYKSSFSQGVKRVPVLNRTRILR
jgi:hydrophobic/amphiphilic exporter-1 (mainly G- bacteria), HAE1 family